MATEVASLFATVGLDTKGVEAGQEKISGALGSIAGGFKKLLGAVAIGVAIKKSFDFMSESVQMAAEEQTGMIKLGMAIENTGQSYDEATDKIEDFLRAETKRAALDDGVGRTSLQVLTEATGDYTKAMKLLPMAEDLARAKGMDLVTASQLIGKVAQGNTAVLTRYGIVMKKGATIAETYAEITKRFGGQAAAWAKSTEGQQAKLDIAFGNIKETLGGAFLPVLAQVAGGIADFITDNLPALEDFMGKVTGLIDRAGGAFGKLWAAFNVPGDLSYRFANVAVTIADMIGGPDAVTKVSNAIGVLRSLVSDIGKGDWGAVFGTIKAQLVTGFNAIWPAVQAAWSGMGGKGLSMEGVEFDFGAVGLKEKLTGWIDDLKGKLTDISPAFAPLITAIESSVARLGDLVTGMDLSGVSAEDFETRLGTLKDFIETQLGPAFSTLVDVHLTNLTTSIQAGNDTLKIMGDVMTTVKGYIDKFTMSINGADAGARSFAGILSSAFTSAVGEQIVSVFTMITNPLVWWITQVGKAQSAWTGFVNALKGGATITAPTAPAMPVRPRAQGGDEWVTRPTLFLAGERGPERVQVTPQGKAGGGGNIVFAPGSIVIQANSPQGRAVLAGLAAAGVKA